MVGNIMREIINLKDMFSKIKVLNLLLAISIAVTAYCNPLTANNCIMDTIPFSCKVTKGVSLSEKNDRGGHMGGIIDNTIVITGGTRWSEDKKEKHFLNNTLILNNHTWKEGPQLPIPMAYSMYGYDDTGLYIAGGTCDGETMLKNVYLLRSIQKGATWERLPDLPEALGYGAGVIMNSKFYISGGKLNNGESSNRMWSLDLNDVNSGWIESQSMPGNARHLHAMATNGINLYVIGGLVEGASLNPLNDIYEFNCKENSWKRLNDLPVKGYAWAAQPVNKTKILLTGRADGKVHKDIWIIDLEGMLAYQIGDLIIQSTTAPLIKVWNNEWWLVGGEPDSNKNRTKEISIINITCNEYENK